MANRKPKRKKQAIQDNYKPPFDQQVLIEPVTNLTFRGENTLELLESAGIKTLGDVLIREEKDFYRIFTFKKKNLLDVKGALKARKLHLKPTKTESAPEEKEHQPQNNNSNNNNNNNIGNNNRNNIANNKSNQKQKNKPNNQQEQKHQNGHNENKKQQKPAVPQDIYIKINKGGKWGFSDRHNKIVIQPQYDEVFSFKEELCCVEKDELFGFIDRKGEEIIPIVYECALSFSEGLACVYKNGKCGYINKSNDVVVDFKFDAGTSFEDGNCRIKRDGKWGELRLDDITNIRWIN